MRESSEESGGGGQFHAAFNSSEPHAKTRRKNAGCCRRRVGEHEHEHASYSCPFVVQKTFPCDYP